VEKWSPRQDLGSQDVSSFSKVGEYMTCLPSAGWECAW
jgi:hypothetical protein